MTEKKPGTEILLRMQAATKAIDEHVARFGKPMRELHIHPDDYLELKREAQPFLTHATPGATDSFSGVRLVQDENAERLPRKGGNMTEEQYLRAQLAELHHSYLKAVEPIVRRLGEIEAAKPFDPRLVLLRARELMAARMEE